MKKHLLALSVIALLASCSKNESDGLNTSANQVQFNTLNDKITRSANDSVANYKVLAKSTIAGESAWYINEAIDGVTDAIISGNTYYYPVSPNTVSFYAYAPASSASINETGVSYETTASIVYTVPTDATEDFTIATPVIGQATGVVPFQFKHMLAKLDFAVVPSDALAASGYAVAFTSAKVVGMENVGTIDAMNPSPSWSAQSGSVTYNGLKTYNVMPQVATGLTVQLMGVTITKGGATIFSGDLKTHTIAAGNITGPTTDSFVMGYKYAITFTITNAAKDDNDTGIFGGEITFSSDTAAWSSATGAITQP